MADLKVKISELPVGVPIDTDIVPYVDATTGKTKQTTVEDLQGATSVTSVNTQTGAVVLDADDISDTSTTNKFATQAELDAIAINSAKTGITTTQADAIVVNSAKNSYPTTDSDKVANVPADTNNELAGKQETLVNQNNIKSVNGETLLGAGDLIVSAGSGGFAANLYFSETASTIDGIYKQLSYTPDVLGVDNNIICNNGETLGEVYLFELPLDTTIIDAGTYKNNIYASVDSISAGETYLRLEIFTKEDGTGTETTLFSTTSQALTTTPGYVLWETTQPVQTVSETSRYGIRIYANTTANQNRTVTYTVGDGNASYTNTPLATRHNQLRERDAENSHPISAITDLQTELDDRLTDAPADGKQYARKDAGWSEVSAGGGGGGIGIVTIAGPQTAGTKFFKYIADGAKTVGKITISLEVAPVGQDFLVKTYKNTVLTDTLTIATSATPTNGEYRTVVDIAEVLADGDVFTAKIDQVGSTVKGADFSCLINIS